VEPIDFLVLPIGGGRDPRNRWEMNDSATNRRGINTLVGLSLANDFLVGATEREVGFLQLREDWQKTKEPSLSTSTPNWNVGWFNSFSPFIVFSN